MWKWKPNKAQKEEFKAKCIEKENSNVKGTIYPIREGCYLKFFSMNLGMVVEGTVSNHSYGAKTNQHTFTIQTDKGMILVKGRNLYPNVIEHKMGQKALSENKYG